MWAVTASFTCGLASAFALRFANACCGDHAAFVNVGGLESTASNGVDFCLGLDVCLNAKFIDTFKRSAVAECKGAFIVNAEHINC